MNLLVIGAVIAIAVFIISYRTKQNEKVYKFAKSQAGTIYEKYAPFSFNDIREKVKELGMDYSVREYTTQIVLFAGVAGGISYLYFYSLVWAFVYALVAISIIPYLTYLKYKRVYSEFIFEKIQVYTTNVLMEYQTTKSFVKALEGVYDSGVLEDPVREDVKIMIKYAYDNGQIDDSINYMNMKYNYMIVKNLHQMFLQVTKEGAHDISGSIDNMSLDIDMLVEGVYRDRMDRSNFHKKFITYGLMLFMLVAVIQVLLGQDAYIKMIGTWYIQLILHVILLLNSYFLYGGEKFYNENVGAE